MIEKLAGCQADDEEKSKLLVGTPFKPRRSAAHWRPSKD